MDKCPSCGSSNIRLVICGSDQFGTLREWSCFQEGCLWTESEELFKTYEEIIKNHKPGDPVVVWDSVSEEKDNGELERKD